MLSENLKTIRKIRGLSQEELSIRLHVVRQTISKWEKGLSVPDADMLVKIAETLDTSVGELLGAAIPDEHEVNDVADQLSRINEQLAVKNRRSSQIWKVVIAVLILLTVFYIGLIILSVSA